jgi:death on curing protein
VYTNKGEDGNKRTALASALVFLDINSPGINDYQGKLYGLVMDTVIGELNKKDIVKVLKNLSV